MSTYIKFIFVLNANILILLSYNKRRWKNKRSRTSLFLGGAVSGAQLGCFFFLMAKLELGKNSKDYLLQPLEPHHCGGGISRTTNN